MSVLFPVSSTLKLFHKYRLRLILTPHPHLLDPFSTPTGLFFTTNPLLGSPWNITLVRFFVQPSPGPVSEDKRVLCISIEKTASLGFISGSQEGKQPELSSWNIF